MTKVHWMGECRSVLSQGPSLACFETLIALFERSGHPPSYVLDALEATLCRWPTSIERRAPGAWLLVPAPGLLRLCNTIRLQDAGLDVWPDDQLRALLRAPGLDGVHHLYLSEARLDAQTSRCLTGLPALTRLSLFHTALPDEALLEIAPLFGRLRALDLGATDASAPALARCLDRATPGLRSLSLEGNRLGDVGACVLAATSALRGLAHLNLARNGIEDGGACALAEHEGRLGGLLTLNLWANAIGPTGQRALRARFSQVRWLQLADNAPTGPVDAFP